MNYRFTFLSWLMFVAALVGLMTARITWRRRSAPGARYLTFLSLAAAEWAVAYGLELAATDIPGKIFWSQIAYPGIVSGPVFIFLFSLAYTQQSRHLNRRNIALLFVVPAITLVIAATHGRQHWLWTGVTIDPLTGVGVYGHGPWFWVMVAYVYTLLCVAMWFLVLAISRFPAHYRSQIGALLVGIVLPTAGNLMYVLGINPLPGLDWTPVGFVLSGFVLAVGIVQFRIFDLVPVARSKLLDIMSDGILVIDAQERVADLNPAMQGILGTLATRAIGQPAALVCARWWHLLDVGRSVGADLGQAGEREVSLGEGTAERCYDLRCSWLRDQQGRLTGQLVVLRDITVRKQLEQERAQLIHELEGALAQVKMLSGLLPICAHCKKIRDDQGYWHSVEEYMVEYSDIEFSHGICPECMQKLYADYARGDPD